MRRLIVCCDGTWNRADWEGGSATNVIRMARCIKPVAAPSTPGGQAISQIVYYHPGVGTGNRIDKMLGGALGIGVAQNVRDAYAFLVNNYEPDDEIFLFGFSRGAFTARVLSGLIRVLGLLSKWEMGSFPDAWSYYRLSDQERDAHRAEFDRLFPDRRAVQVQCIAVWDTVSALGLAENRITGKWQPCASEYRFLRGELGAHVNYAFQALAIDEHRGPFLPQIWHQMDPAPPGQLLKQMWFVGVHSDIGGGYAKHGRSDVALLWIASELIAHGLLDLDIDRLGAEFDRETAYGTARPNDSESWLYRHLTPVRDRAVAHGPTEFVHETVRQCVDAGWYRNQAFLDDRLTSKIAALNPLERQLNNYTIEPYKRRPQFLPRLPSFCDRLVRWFLQ
jgi:uncharacterized protein (DUF2235 family)